MKNGTRQRGVADVLRRRVRISVRPKVVPRRKARSEIPESDLSPVG